MVTGIAFLGLIILAIASAISAVLCIKYAVSENKGSLKYRSYGIILLGVGFIVHTLGDYLSAGYGELTELSLESLAHVIILIAFIMFILASKDILINAKRYWFK